MTKKTLKQVDETKKPVITQLIADLIEECKKDGKSLHYFGATDEVRNFLKEGGKRRRRENEDTLIRAWTYGYEVDK